MLMAILRYAPGLRATARYGAALLGTAHASTLSYALRRRSTLAMVRAMVERLSGAGRFAADALVAVDGMAITFWDSRPHGCARFAPGVAGGGVIWAMALGGRRSAGAAVRVLRLVEGAWSDAGQMRTVALQAGGPVYLMDRGFWSLGLIERWLAEGVRFIVRATAAQLRWRTLSVRGPARRAGRLRIERDVVARLGAESAKRRPGGAAGGHAAGQRQGPDRAERSDGLERRADSGSLPAALADRELSQMDPSRRRDWRIFTACSSAGSRRCFT